MLKRKQTPSPGPAIIEISSDEEDSSHSLPPAKRPKSDTPVGNGWSAAAPNGSRGPSFAGRPSVQSSPPAASITSRDGVNGVKTSPWKRLSSISYPHTASLVSHRDDSALDFKHEQSPLPRNRPSPKAATPLADRIAKVREAARSETPSLTRPSSSSQKVVSVEVPLRLGSRAAESPGKHGGQFPSRHQGPRSNIEVQIPPSERKVERRHLLRELEQSARVAIEKPDLVHRVCGQTGFSPVFSVEEDVRGMRKVASKKKKKAPSSEVDLNCGDPLISSLQRLHLGKMVHPADSARQVLTSRFEENITPPLTFANDVNQRRLHGKFQFTDQYIIREGIKMASPSKNTGCSCADCDQSTCECFTKTVPDEVGRGTHEEQVRTYVRRPDGLVVLSNEYIDRELNPEGKHRFAVAECNDLCTCGADCWNRVVSKGRTVPLEIFQTAKCGFGVRSSQDIHKGQFIQRYLGEIITEAELRRREDTADEGDSSYIYSLDWFAAINDKQYHVDGKYFGSAMRFVNHSCNPNVRCIAVQQHKGDKKVYNLAIFAIKDIKAGVEIRIDYQARPASSEGSDAEAEAEAQGGSEGDEELVRCYCGEKNCRKYLWPSSAKERRRRRRISD